MPERMSFYQLNMFIKDTNFLYPSNWMFDHQMPFDPDKEIKNLAQLIAEPRQSKEFKSKHFFYEGTKKAIPQSVIDKLR